MTDANPETLNEQERRQRRFDLAEQFAREVATWSSKKLRNCYAQPDAVRRAEERERLRDEKDRAICREVCYTAHEVKAAGYRTMSDHNDITAEPTAYERLQFVADNLRTELVSVRRALRKVLSDITLRQPCDDYSTEDLVSEVLADAVREMQDELHAAFADRDSLKAKLAALVDACDRLREATYPQSGEPDIESILGARAVYALALRAAKEIIDGQ